MAKTTNFFGAELINQLAKQQRRWDEDRLPPWNASTAIMSATAPSTATIELETLSDRKAPLRRPLADLAHIKSMIRYKPGARVEELRYEDPMLRITVSCPAFDVNTGYQTRINSGMEILVPLPLLNEELVVKTIYECFIKLELHEAGEYFNYRNSRVFDPHESKEQWPASIEPPREITFHEPLDYEADPYSMEIAMKLVTGIINEQT